MSIHSKSQPFRSGKESPLKIRPESSQEITDSRASSRKDIVQVSRMYFRSRSNGGTARKRQEVAKVRPPKWEAADTSRNPSRASIAVMKRQQEQTLDEFRAFAKSERWGMIHQGHFDWWMFPIDDGSRSEFNVGGDLDILELRGDGEWHEGYKEAVTLVLAAWGWNVDELCLFDPPRMGMGWTDWDVRLSKIIRSLWLFEEEALFHSVQAFARVVQKTHKNGESFMYAGICLDELLFMKLPRRSPLSQSRSAPFRESLEEESPIRGPSSSSSGDEKRSKGVGGIFKIKK